ncbi:MAG: coproporphyrinogen III oxidase, partial [Burkholderiaceae bacterium]|nr:coproporphyrinogen III oxidase [Burkholderiaceae bacterium]
MSSKVAGSATTLDADAVRDYLSGLQERIVTGLEALDGQAFRRDAWQRSEGGGGGLSCVIEEGGVFERGAVLFSHVHGAALPASASAQRAELAGRPFEAMGVSLVLHPRNPYVPTVHMNVRFLFAPAAQGGGAAAWWFGGGMDLTPYYPFEKVVVLFHETCRQA